MGKRTSRVLNLRQRLTLPSLFIGDSGYWTMTELAIALGVSEQTVRKWALNGQIPKLVEHRGKNYISEHAVKFLEEQGVGEIGHYAPISKTRAQKLRAAGYRVPNSASMKKKGGAA